MKTGLAFQDGVLESFAASAKSNSSTLENNAFDTPKFNFEEYSRIQSSDDLVAGFIVSPIYSHTGLKTTDNGLQEEVASFPVYGVTPIDGQKLTEIIDQEAADQNDSYFFEQKGAATDYADSQNYASKCAYDEQKRIGILNEVNSWTKEEGTSLADKPEGEFKIHAQSNDLVLNI